MPLQKGSLCFKRSVQTKVAYGLLGKGEISVSQIFVTLKS